ncbi:ATP:Cob(I)alamin adenosyltransferase [hydrothermal vent metagenome]|uniref:ATP:Cob(I)alamin adenosyltransferase n=1 Tax=hydrothermal vent metagenome TaxID=652676 RepID=A0A3B0YMZ7_9ZZZZ
MGHRLSKIYTRTGDKGHTGLAGGERISKTSLRIELLGTIDELNSAIGLVIAHENMSLSGEKKVSHSDSSKNQQQEIITILITIQHDLFDIGGELCMPGQAIITEQRVTGLEQKLDNLNETLPWLKEFILPGGNIPAAQCHLARSIARRAERVVVALSLEEEEGNQTINPITLAYLNRLSDLLFVVARCLARSNDGQEVFWKKDISPKTN